MKNKEIDEILNYMKQYVENKYEHDSEPMLNYKDLQIVLSYIEQLENNRDKAIEIIKKDWYKLNSRNIDEISDTKTDIRITLYNILKGDSE